MQKLKISIIVPVYNVSKYVDKCIDSLINQTYSNLEIIIVDDCSTDNSVKIVKNKIKNHNNIYFYRNNANEGLSFTRNFALSKCSGNYISYIDSDDYIPNNYYEEMMKNEGADIIVCDIIVIDIDNNFSRREYCGGKTNFEFVDHPLAASVCNKLFKREIIEKYKFSEGKINEDLAVTLPCLIEAKSIRYTDKTYYNYIQRNTSIQNMSFSEKRFDIFYGVKLTFERIKNSKEFGFYKDSILFNQIIALFLYVIPKEKKFKKRYRWIKKFGDLSKELSIINNKYLIEFINNQSLKAKYYYKILFMFLRYRLFFMCNLLIEIVTNYLNRKKSVIKNDITIEDLIKLSIIQNNLPVPEISISVVIPNYNYKKFLFDRLYSILSQTYKIKEIIILDDDSTDNSRELIDEIVKNIEPYIKIKKVFNRENSGSAFKQWDKGFSLSSGDYVWIAEADDYCSSNLLSELIKPIKKDNKIIISYANTAFIDSNGRIIVKNIVREIDLMNTNHWEKAYINDGKEEYLNYSFLNCTIANVSSCIIKNDCYQKELQLSGEYKQAGDWLFYVNIMQRGKVAFNNKILNYYRVHGNNVSSTMKKEEHLNEIKKIHNYYREKYGLNKFQECEIIKRYDFLKKVWEVNDER